MRSWIMVILGSGVLYGNCLTVDMIKTTQTPVDLFGNMKTCIEEKSFDQAATLYMVSQAYGYFDTLRVKDKSAHQAVTVLQTGTHDLLKQNDDKQAFLLAINTLIEQHDRSCQFLKTLGYPTYTPDYMINHGLWAMKGKKSESLDKKFVPKEAWKQTLITFMKCPE